MEGVSKQDQGSSQGRGETGVKLEVPARSEAIRALVRPPVTGAALRRALDVVGMSYSGAQDGRENSVRSVVAMAVVGELLTALKAAHHALTTSHNLRASDLSREAFEAHVANGSDPATMEWTIDHGPELDRIEAAIAKAEGAAQ